MESQAIDTETDTVIKVWIVEDHSGFRETIAYILDSEPSMSCAASFSSYESLEKVIEKKRGWEAPDLVLMDYNLPGKNGIEGLRHLKEKFPLIPIVILTVEDNEELIFTALQSGASGYLTKEADLDRIVSVVQETHKGGALMPPTVARKVLKYFTTKDIEELKREEKKTPIDGGDKKDYGLTPREKEILYHMGNGLAHKQIAHELFLSYHTVDSHVRNVYRKLHVSSGIEAVAKAYREGLFDDEE